LASGICVHGTRSGALRASLPSARGDRFLLAFPRPDRRE